MTSPYTAIILEHFRRPRNRGPLADPHVSHELLNPLCGDRIRIELRLAEGRVAAAAFQGDACAICIAAASLLTGMLPGLGLTEAASFPPERLFAALQAPIPESRRRCALLPLEAVRASLGSPGAA